LINRFQVHSLVTRKGGRFGGGADVHTRQELIDCFHLASEANATG
jgi:hypothetical protein